MRLLLDTHAFLWFITNDPQLSATAKSLIADPNNEILVSPASYWETAIKISIRKYPLSVPFETFITQGIDGNGFKILPIEPRHTAVLTTMPFHHRDPFDRMLPTKKTRSDLSPLPFRRARSSKNGFSTIPTTSSLIRGLQEVARDRLRLRLRYPFGNELGLELLLTRQAHALVASQLGCLFYLRPRSVAPVSAASNGHDEGALWGN